jgi:putative flavoprotein involved in K+ transport
LGRSFLILDAHERLGDAWRERWDSLRLFTPAYLSALPGLVFPGRGSRCPTKDEMADYLETYAARFDLSVRIGTHVDSITKIEDRFLVSVMIIRSRRTMSCWLPEAIQAANRLDLAACWIGSSHYRFGSFSPAWPA